MGEQETEIQPTYPVKDPRNPAPVGSTDARATFIGRSRAHLTEAMVAFTLLEVLLFSTGLAESIARALKGVNWLLVLGAFMAGLAGQRPTPLKLLSTRTGRCLRVALCGGDGGLWQAA